MSVHRRLQPDLYSTHEHGDSAYDHSEGKAKASSLGAAVLVTLGFSAVELLAGLAANSLALVGSAGLMAAESTALLFALASGLWSRHGADEDHSFGHGRLEALAAFANGVAMAVLSLWVLAESLLRLFSPEPVAGGIVAAVSAAGLLVASGALIILFRSGKASGRSALLFSAVLAGPAAALASGFSSLLGGPVSADPGLALALVALLAVSIARIFRGSCRVLLDAVPDGVSYEAVGDAISAVPGILRVHDLHVWTMAPGHGAIQCHVLIRDPGSWPVVLDQVRITMKGEFGIDHIAVQPEWEDRE